MYEPDGTESLVALVDQEGQHHRLTLDVIDEANMMNAGAEIISATPFIRPPEGVPDANSEIGS